MAWEQSITFAFIGSALVVAYIGSNIKEDEENLSWIRYFPIGVRTFFYFVAFGLLLFGIGVQTPILMENGIFVNTTEADSNEMLGNAVSGGVTVATKLFYASIVILLILAVVYVIYNVLATKKMKQRAKEDYEDDEY